MDKKVIKSIVSENKVEVIRLFFTDVLGHLKGLNIDVQELDRALDEGIVFDGSSIEGFVRINESDLLAMPDHRTFQMFPFSDAGVSSAFFICDVLKPDGTPLESDPRQVLSTAVAKAKAMGFDDFFVGPELEYFYFPSSLSTEMVDLGGYFDVLPLDQAAQARSRTLSTLRAMGMPMEAAHHEVAPSQHEIDFRYGEAVTMADRIMIAKVIIKEVARQHGLYATFMPKPVNGVNGSGMHVHQSLFKNGENAFFSADDPYNLSPVGRSYIEGILRYSKEITVITNQNVNSYKRLVPGYEAPVYIAWGRKNRTALVRVPSFKQSKPASCRIEYRAPDAAANPYLAFAVMLSAGLRGIEEGLELRSPVELDVFSMTQAEKDERGIESLPGDLYSATLQTSKSELVQEALGKELFDKIIANKLEEWERYRSFVTNYEIDNYLPSL